LIADPKAAIRFNGCPAWSLEVFRPADGEIHYSTAD
jgi:hypothetical protein